MVICYLVKLMEIGINCRILSPWSILQSHFGERISLKNLSYLRAIEPHKILSTGLEKILNFLGWSHSLNKKISKELNNNRSWSHLKRKRKNIMKKNMMTSITTKMNTRKICEYLYMILKFGFNSNAI